MSEFNLEQARRIFVAKVSWGPTRIGFGEAITAFDETMRELGLGERVSPSSYSPAVDSLDVPLKASSAVELEEKVLSEVRKGKKIQPKEDTGMVLDDEQENAEALKNTGRN